MPQDRIGLTVAGLVHVERAEALVDAFLNLVSALGTARKKVTIDPLSDALPTLSREVVLRDRLPSPVWEDRVFGLLTKEPSTWHCVFNPQTPNWASVDIPPTLRSYDCIESPGHYLELLKTQLAPSAEELATSQSVPGIGFEPLSQAFAETPPADEPYVFVIMPFTQIWSDQTYALVKRVGATIKRSFTFAIERLPTK